MSTIWRDACIETPDCCDEFKDKLFVVHTAPIIQGMVDLANSSYSVATWDKDNKIWKISVRVILFLSGLLLTDCGKNLF